MIIYFKILFYRSCSQYAKANKSIYNIEDYGCTLYTFKLCSRQSILLQKYVLLDLECLKIYMYTKMFSIGTVSSPFPTFVSQHCRSTKYFQVLLPMCRGIFIYGLSVKLCILLKVLAIIRTIMVIFVCY